MAKKKLPTPDLAFDCIIELKALPPQFWEGVPTASELPHRLYTKQIEHGPKVTEYRKNFTKEAWEIFIKNAHRLHPMWCEPEKRLFYGDHVGRDIPKTFRTYSYKGTIYFQYHSSGALSYESSYMAIFKDIGKDGYINYLDAGVRWSDKNEFETDFNNTWNRLRLKALRKAGKLAAPSVIKAEKEADKEEKNNEYKEIAYNHAKELRSKVTVFMNDIKYGNMDEGKISELYDCMIEMAKINKEWKEAVGTLLKVK